MINALNHVINPAAQGTQASPQTENQKRKSFSEEIPFVMQKKLRAFIDSKDEKTTPSTTSATIEQLRTSNSTSSSILEPTTFIEHVRATQESVNNSSNAALSYSNEDYWSDLLSIFDDTESTIDSFSNHSQEASESDDETSKTTSSLNGFSVSNHIVDYIFPIPSPNPSIETAESSISSLSNDEYEEEYSISNNDLIASMKDASLEEFKILLTTRQDLLDNINSEIMTDEMGLTCLLWAVRAERLDIIKYLVEEKHAEIDSQMHLNAGWYLSVYLAIEKGSDSKPLARESKEIAKYLVSKGALLNKTFSLDEDDTWTTLLGYNCFNCSFTNLQFIVETLGADVNAPDNDGKTPLFVTLKRISEVENETSPDKISQELADRCKSLAKIVLYLIKHGADVNQTLTCLTEKKNRGDSSAGLAILALNYILDLASEPYVKTIYSTEIGLSNWNY